MQAAELVREKRYSLYSSRLMILAWGIEFIAVAVGLAIAVSRIVEAGQGGEPVGFWQGLQVGGGFVIVAVAELTKIPLAVLLVNVRGLLKPVMLGILIFLSLITFETVFLSLEQGFNIQNSELRQRREQIYELERQLDFESLEKQIVALDESNKIEENRKQQLISKFQGQKFDIEEQAQKQFQEMVSNNLGASEAQKKIERQLIRLQDLEEDRDQEIQGLQQEYEIKITEKSAEIDEPSTLLASYVSFMRDGITPDVAASEIIELQNLEADFERELRVLRSRNSSLMISREDQLSSLEAERDKLFASGDVPQDEVNLKNQIDALQEQLRVKRETRKQLIDEVQDQYQTRKADFEKSEKLWLDRKAEARQRNDAVAAREAQREARRYRGYIDKLAPATERKKIEREIGPIIEEMENGILELREKLSLKQSERLEEKQQEIRGQAEALDSKISFIKSEIRQSQAKNTQDEVELEEKFSNKEALIRSQIQQRQTDLSQQISSLKSERSSLKKEFSDKKLSIKKKFEENRTSLQESLSELKNEYDKALSSVEKDNQLQKQRLSEIKNRKIERLEQQLNYNIDSIDAGIKRNETAQNDIRDLRKIAEDNKLSNETELRTKQNEVCDLLIKNQIYRISGKFDASWFFGGSVDEPQNVTTYNYCPQQAFVDETNADRIALLWFGSIGLLAATAGIVTAIAGQIFVRMAEEPYLPQSQRNIPLKKFFGSLRLLIVRWRKLRVKTVKSEKLIEIPTEIIKEVEIVKEVEKIVEKEVEKEVEVEKIIKEIVPFPVFVPSGADVERELNRVKASYEDVNKKMADAAEALDSDKKAKGRRPRATKN